MGIGIPIAQSKIHPTFPFSLLKPVDFFEFWDSAEVSSDLSAFQLFIPMVHLIKI